MTRKGNPSRWSTRAIFRARRSDKFRHEASSATRNTARFVARLAASSYAVLCTRSFSCLFHALVVASGCAAASAKPSLISALCFPPTPGCHLSPKNFKNPLNVVYLRAAYSRDVNSAREALSQSRAAALVLTSTRAFNVCLNVSVYMLKLLPCAFTAGWALLFSLVLLLLGVLSRKWNACFVLNLLQAREFLPSPISSYFAFMIIISIQRGLGPYFIMPSPPRLPHSSIPLPSFHFSYLTLRPALLSYTLPPVNV